MNKIIKEIRTLKKEGDWLIIAHNYQLPEVQDEADFLGDSLELAKKAGKLEKENVLFCGVRFMAESAKIISPEKNIHIPEPDAGCPMADMITADDVRKMREKYPDHVFVAYVNTSAEVKAEVDICCTSANALDIVESLKGREVFFLPDKNLGAWVKKESSTPVTLWPGFCYVHNRITLEDLDAGRAAHPEAAAMIHPEAPMDVLEKADAVLSTGQMIQFAEKSSAQSFLVGTEEGMIYRLQKLFPDKRFYMMGRRFTCENMKKITLEKMAETMKQRNNRIQLSEEVIRRAAESLHRMLQR